VHPHLQAALERYDRVAAEFSIESRHPLLDIRLAEFCLSLPWYLKTRRGWTKAIMREMMICKLPEPVVWRRDKDSLGWQVNTAVLLGQADYFKAVLEAEAVQLRN